MEIEQLADVFVEVADTLVADFDLIEFLHTVARHAPRSVTVPRGGLMLTGQDGTLHHIGASSEDARLLELFQIQNDEGPVPGLLPDRSAGGGADLARPTSAGPGSAARARGRIAAVHAFPMRLRDQVIGGLNVFQIERRDLDDGDVRGSPGTGRPRHHLADPGAGGRPGGRAHRAAPGRAQQPDRDRAGQGRRGTDLRHRRGRGVRDAAQSRADSRRRLTDVAHEVVTSPEGPLLLRPE